MCVVYLKMTISFEIYYKPNLFVFWCVLFSHHEIKKLNIAVFIINDLSVHIIIIIF